MNRKSMVWIILCILFLGLSVPLSVSSNSPESLTNDELYDEVVYENNILMKYPCSKSDSIYEIPEGTIGFEETAFYNLGPAFLNVLYIPASCTQIESSAFERGGFDSMVAYIVNSDNSSFASIDGVLFSKDLKTLIAYPRGRTNTEYTIPNGTEIIGDMAFVRSMLSNIHFPESLRIIGEEAFSFCEQLTTVSFPENLEELELGAFSCCTTLESVYFPKTLRFIGGNVFQSCSLQYLIIPEGVQSIAGSAFYGNPIEIVFLPESLSFIGNGILGWDYIDNEPYQPIIIVHQDSYAYEYFIQFSDDYHVEVVTNTSLF